MNKNTVILLSKAKQSKAKQSHNCILNNSFKFYISQFLNAFKFLSASILLHNLVKTFLTSITFDSLSRKIKNPCLVINKNSFFKEEIIMYNFKKLFTYMVVGALVAALSISCKSNEEPSTPELSQYAGVYASDNKDFGSSENQYFVIRINSDNTVDYCVSDNKSFSTVKGTFPAYFFISSDSSYNLKLTVDKPIGDAGLTFSSDGNTITYRVDRMIDGVYCEKHLKAQTFAMTKVS